MKMIILKMIYQIAPLVFWVKENEISENVSDNELKEIINEQNLTSLLENSNEEINSNYEIKDSSIKSLDEKLIDIKINIVNDIIKNNKTKELQKDENKDVDYGNNIA